MTLMPKGVDWFGRIESITKKKNWNFTVNMDHIYKKWGNKSKGGCFSIAEDILVGIKSLIHELNAH